MKTILYAVRHGETEWNLMGRQQGHLDSPLTENGIRQAQFLAGGLIKRRIDILFSSDLGRAMQTAKIIADRLCLDIHADARLREIHLGIMQGLTRKEFEERHPEEAAQIYSGNPDYVLPGGESLGEMFARHVSCAEEIAANNAGKNILIVGHGGVLRSFFHRAANTPIGRPRRYSLYNASINAFLISNGEWRLSTWGEIGHLGDSIPLDDF
jgi:2,3-bisphosphoglycerate-dependent phosphoglycerate mutase